MVAKWPQKYRFIVVVTFDLLTSKFYKFIFASKRTKAVNLVKFRRAINKILRSQSFGMHSYLQINACAHSPKDNAFGTILVIVIFVAEGLLYTTFNFTYIFQNQP